MTDVRSEDVSGKIEITKIYRTQMTYNNARRVTTLHDIRKGTRLHFDEAISIDEKQGPGVSVKNRKSMMSR